MDTFMDFYVLLKVLDYIFDGEFILHVNPGFPDRVFVLTLFQKIF